MNIIIADDDNVCRIILGSHLERMGHYVEGVRNGNDLIAACRMVAYDLIITDIDMPGISGIEATREIRKFNTTTPIVASSASDGISLSDDFNYILKKPIRKKEIEFMFDILKLKINTI